MGIFISGTSLLGRLCDKKGEIQMPLLRHQPMPPVPTAPGVPGAVVEAPVINILPTFRSVEKTFAETVQMLMKNERLGKLLYYTDKHAEGLPALTQSQFQSLLNEQIKIVPKLNVDPDAKPYVIISMDNFAPEIEGSDFRSATLSFDILAPYDFWLLDDFRLRPYAIAGEIDGMINNSRLQGRTALFMGAKQLILDKDVGGVSLYYHLDTSFDDAMVQGA